MYYSLINSMNKTVAPSIVTSGLVLNLDAGNPSSYPGSGTTWTDLSTSSNNATLINGTGYSSANGGTLVFDGINDYAVTANNIGISSNQTRSVDIWFKLNNNTARHVLSSWGNLSANNLFNLEVNSNYGTNYPFLAIYNNDAYIPQTIAINQWTNIVITYAGGNVDSPTGVKFYLNGALQSGVLFPSSPFGNYPFNTTNTKLYVGYEGAGARNPMNGYLPTVKIYNKALDSTEVTTNFNAIKSRYGL